MFLISHPLQNCTKRRPSKNERQQQQFKSNRVIRTVKTTTSVINVETVEVKTEEATSRQNALEHTHDGRESEELELSSQHNRYIGGSGKGNVVKSHQVVKSVAFKLESSVSSSQAERKDQFSKPYPPPPQPPPSKPATQQLVRVKAESDILQQKNLVTKVSKCGSVRPSKKGSKIGAGGSSERTTTVFDKVRTRTRWFRIFRTCVRSQVSFLHANPH